MEPQAELSEMAMLQQRYEIVNNNLVQQMRINNDLQAHAVEMEHHVGILTRTVETAGLENQRLRFELAKLKAEGQLVLEKDDPFDETVWSMVQMNRKKRLDYAGDDDPLSNFRDSANDLGMPGFGPVEAAYQLLLTKVARLKSLRRNGRMDDPANESVLDTYIDLAVYAAIVLTLKKEEIRKHQEFQEQLDREMDEFDDEDDD